jgi:type VI secretion system secreted protein Hcp
MAQFDYFLKMDGIKGESLKEGHKDEIDVLSFSWGVSQTGTMAHGGGGGEGKATFHDFNFTTKVSKASPTLFLDCASGLHIKQAVVVGETSSDVDRGANQFANQFFKYTFTDVIISSYQDAGSESRDVMDSAALSYGSVKVEATPGARIGIEPAAFGNLMLDANGQPTVVEGQNGLLLSGPVVNSDGILIGMSRGISEFSLDDVLGLISGPSPHMQLVLGVREVRPLGEQVPGNTDLAALTTDLVTNDSHDEDGKKPKKKSLQHNVYLYTDVDLELSPDDFGRRGRRLGRLELDPDGDPLQQDFDLTDIVLDGNLGSIGIRIQSAMDHAHPGNEDEDQDPSEAESETAESRAAAPRATAFMLTLEVVAD